MAKEMSDEDAALRLFRYTSDERAEMTKAVKRIDSLLNHEEITGTNLDKEFSEFRSHLGNIKGLMPERYRLASERELIMIRLYSSHTYQLKARQEIRKRLDDILTYPIDYSSRYWKKISAHIIANGMGGGVSVERF